MIVVVQTEFAKIRYDIALLLVLQNVSALFQKTFATHFEISAEIIEKAQYEM